jgi:hypothetical protein
MAPILSDPPSDTDKADRAPVSRRLATRMRQNRWFSNALLIDFVGWLCVLAVLALVALLTSGALEAVLTVAAVIAWVVALGRPADRSEQRERGAPLLVVLAPVFVGLAIASAVVSEEWYAFAALAIAFPLMVVWRNVYWRWQDRRATHGAA